MAELGYRPHRAARALRTGRTQTIGLVVSTLATVGNSRMLQAVADAAAHRGYALTVVTARRRGSPRRRLRAAARPGRRRRDRAQRGDGRRTRARMRRADLALVVVDSPRRTSRFGVVQSDHAGGARAATDAPARARPPRPLHLAGPDDSFAAAERERGWRAALEGAGLVAPPVVRGDWTAASGHSRGDRPRRPTRRDGRLRRERPDGARRAARARRGRPRACPATSAWSASTTSRMPPTTCLRSPPCVRTSTRSASGRSMHSSARSMAVRRRPTSCRPGSSCAQAQAPQREPAMRVVLAARQLQGVR